MDVELDFLVLSFPTPSWIKLYTDPKININFAITIIISKACQQPFNVIGSVGVMLLVNIN